MRNAGARPSIVVKIGGSTLGSRDTTIRDLVAAQRQGLNPVVVHGGGSAITSWLATRGARTKFVRGLRVTDKATLDIVVAVLTGLINKRLTASALAEGGRALGLSGIDGGLLRGVKISDDLGYVGRIAQVDVEPILVAVAAGYMPIIAPVAIDLDEGGGAPLNINADTAAGEIAAALDVERLVFMTDVEGVLDSTRRLIPRITERQARELMSSRVIDGGMIPKIGACLINVGKGKTTRIIGGNQPDALRRFLDGESLGTRVG